MPVYECGTCEAALPPGVRACLKCGEQFEEAVPDDAVVPPRGFTMRSDAPEILPPVTSVNESGSSPPADATHPAHSSGYPWLDAPSPTPQKPSMWNTPVGGPALLAIVILAGLGWLVHGMSGSSGETLSRPGSVSPAPPLSDGAPVDETPASPSTDPSTTDTAPSGPQLRVGSENFTKESEYDIISGEVTNISGESLGNVEAVTTFYDASGNVVKTEDALIDYNPILPGQTSPYKTMGTDNPLIKREKTTFQVLGGAEIETTTSAPPASHSDNAPSGGSSAAYGGDPSVPVAAFRARLKLARNRDISRCVRSVREGDDIGVLELKVSHDYMARTTTQRAEMRKHFLSLWRKVSLEADATLSVEDNFISTEDSSGVVLGTLSSSGYEDFNHKG